MRRDRLRRRRSKVSMQELDLMHGTAMACYRQAEQYGDSQALERAITIWAEIAAAAPAGLPECARYYCGLGIALQTRFEGTGSLDDLHEAISRYREAISVALADDPACAGYCRTWATRCASGTGEPTGSRI